MNDKSIHPEPEQKPADSQKSVFLQDESARAPIGGDSPAATRGASRFARQSGKVRPMILLWALGVPIPIILVILLVRGCTG